MDRTQEWWQAVDVCCQHLDVAPARRQQLKSQSILRRQFEHPPFMKAALAVLQSIHELRDFISLHQEGYLGKDTYSDRDKDHIEAEVGALVKECAQRVEQLKQSVVAAQQQASQASWPQPHHSTAPALLNGQTIAHRHGVVLTLAEQLAAVSARFDRCRVQRYQQLTDSARPQPLPSGGLTSKESKAASTTGRHAAGKGGGGRTSLLAAANGSQAVAKLKGVVFSHVKGVTETVLGVSSQREAAHALEEHEEASRQQQQQRPHTGLLQQQLELENNDIVAQLTTTAQSVHSVERSVREIAALNQLFSSAVLHQAEAIEVLYNNAVEASMNLRQGNKELKKTIEVNKSSRKIVLVILLAASLGLLFFDWFNS